MPKSRDEKILSAAAELFRKRGFAAVGVDEIGRQAGVSGPAIYRHFRSKDDILAALFDQGLDDLVSRTSGSFEDPETELRHLVAQHAGAILANPRLASIWIHEGRSLSAQNRHRFHRRSDAYLERWTTVLQRCYPDADQSDVQILAHSAIGAINSVMDWPGGLRDAERIDRLTEGVVRGMSVLGEPSPETPAVRAA